MSGTIFDVDGIPALGRLLLFAGSAMARTYNSRPEQKVARHTEETSYEAQFPSARTQPEPRRLMSLDLAQRVISENEETQHRRQLVTAQATTLAYRDFFFR